MPVEIRDPADPRLDAFRNLKDADLRRLIERRDGVFIVEGPIAAQRVIGTRWPICSALIRPEQLAPMEAVVEEADRQGAPVYVAGSDVFDHVAGFHIHRGVLVLAGRLPELDAFDLLARTRLALVVEGVNDHENLGALFRNAAAFGAGAVLMDPTCCDPLYRRCVRVSVGHVLRIPFARLVPWPEALGRVRSAGFSVVALSPDADTTIDEVARSVSGPAALLVGAEGHGLSSAARAASTCVARIPMAAGVDSLNVATAAAIALHRLAHL